MPIVFQFVLMSFLINEIVNNAIKRWQVIFAVYQYVQKYRLLDRIRNLTKRHDKELMAILREKGINYSEDMDGPLRPGSVVFVQTPDGITHRDYVTQAWTEHPVKDVLVKMAATPALTRVASAPYASR